MYVPVAKFREIAGIVAEESEAMRQSLHPLLPEMLQLRADEAVRRCRDNTRTRVMKVLETEKDGPGIIVGFMVNRRGFGGLLQLVASTNPEHRLKRKNVEHPRFNANEVLRESVPMRYQIADRLYTKLRKEDIENPKQHWFRTAPEHASNLLAVVIAEWKHDRRRGIEGKGE